MPQPEARQPQLEAEPEAQQSQRQQPQQLPPLPPRPPTPESLPPTPAQPRAHVQLPDARQPDQARAPCASTPGRSVVPPWRTTEQQQPLAQLLVLPLPAPLRI